MVTRFDKCGWDQGTADESSQIESISIPGTSGALSSLEPLLETTLSNLPVYETQLGFMYIGESFDEDKTVPRNEDQAGFSFKSHYSEENGIFARLLAAETAASSGAELVSVGFNRSRIA